MMMAQALPNNPNVFCWQDYKDIDDKVVPGRQPSAGPQSFPRVSRSLKEITAKSWLKGASQNAPPLQAACDAENNFHLNFR
jgi:hypothetical protein